MVKGIFLSDFDILGIIKEIEVCLGLENKEVDKMNYIELINYINNIILMLLN